MVAGLGVLESSSDAAQCGSKGRRFGFACISRAIRPT